MIKLTEALLIADNKKAKMQGKLYQDFRGVLHKVVDVAVDFDTHEPVVVYSSVIRPNITRCMPLVVFESDVDRQKHPGAKQLKYFEEVTTDSDTANDSETVIAIMKRPHNCSECVFGVCKSSHPYWSNSDACTKEYYCQLQPPELRTVEKFDYDAEVHLSNCPLIPITSPVIAT